MAADVPPFAPAPSNDKEAALKAASTTLSTALRREPRLALLHCVYNVDSTQNSVCEKCIVNESRRVGITPFRVLWGCRRIFHDGYFKTLLQQFTQMRFDTHVGQHSAKNDFVDLPLE